MGIDAQTWASVIAAVVAVVSTGFTLWLQWWRKPKVVWSCQGWATETWDNGRRTGDLFTVHAFFVNCGDAAAYGVDTTRNVGGGLRSFSSFEAGVVNPGEQFEIVMLVHPAGWESCWVELAYRSSPIRRSGHRPSSQRFYLERELGGQDRLRPRYNPKEPGPSPGIPQGLRQGSGQGPTDQ